MVGTMCEFYFWQFPWKRDLTFDSDHVLCQYTTPTTLLSKSPSTYSEWSSVLCVYNPGPIWVNWPRVIVRFITYTYYAVFPKTHLSQHKTEKFCFWQILCSCGSKFISVSQNNIDPTLFLRVHKLQPLFRNSKTCLCKELLNLFWFEINYNYHINQLSGKIINCNTRNI